MRSWSKSDEKEDPAAAPVTSSACVWWFELSWRGCTQTLFLFPFSRLFSEERKLHVGLWGIFRQKETGGRRWACSQHSRVPAAQRHGHYLPRSPRGTVSSWHSRGQWARRNWWGCNSFLASILTSCSCCNYKCTTCLGVYLKNWRTAAAAWNFMSKDWGCNFSVLWFFSQQICIIWRVNWRVGFKREKGCCSGWDFGKF